MEKDAISKVIVLAAKTGLYFSHVDGSYDEKEKNFINSYIERLSQIGPVDEVKDELNEALNSTYTQEQVVEATKDLLSEFNGLDKALIKAVLTQYVRQVIKADGETAEAEQKAFKEWKEAID